MPRPHALLALTLLVATACDRPDAEPTPAPTPAASGAEAPRRKQRTVVSPNAPLPDGVGAIDLPARIASLESEHPLATDRSETYFAAGDATVHMHLMGREQIVPLHVHREAEEATIIISGEARVLQLFGRDGHLARQEGVYGPGALVESPPWCGHEWVNPDAEKTLGNLVFAFPRFHGNLYVRPEDPRLIEGGEPFAYDPAEELREFAASDEDVRTRKLPIMNGAMSILLLKKRHVVLPNPKGAVVGYVFAGTLHVKGYDDVGPRNVLLFNSSSPVVLRARDGGPVAVLLFDPHGTDGHSGAEG